MYSTVEKTTEYIEWQRPLSGVHFIKMEILAQAGERGGVHAHPLFTISTITYKVVMYATAERADTLPHISTLPLFLLCGKDQREGLPTIIKNRLVCLHCQPINLAAPAAVGTQHTHTVDITLTRLLSPIS